MAKNSESSSKNQETKKDSRVCEKIFRAMTSPVRTVRRLSTKPSPKHHQAEPVRVKFSETSTQAAKPISKMEPLITRVETKLKTDERFTDYIKKAKLKIRAVTNPTSEAEARDHRRQCHVPTASVSRERSSGRSSDHFSEYIRKAKMKLRSSTIARANPTYKD
ncbi:hypothetical protein Bca52824_079911 [Brassica carinata]|uniref:Uncharacterized protein n=1 Tax=Brassica carinata TaxID=52824 RepID=A0A8X7Q054_BRACI|nr:hypothetical protein Bca52824_079911 [Brassica carinata]